MDTDSTLSYRIPALASLVFALLSLAFFPQGSRAGTNGDVGVSSVNVLPPDSLDYTVGITGEFDRKLTAGKTGYDNVRLQPLGVRYGFWKNLQFGADLRYSSNSPSENSGPDNGGVEAFTASTKYRWNRNFAVETSLGLGITEDVFPYGGNGVQFGLNLPWMASMGPGSLIGELGYTLNQGEVNDTIDWSGYLNYGLGYQYELTRTLALKTEIAGHGGTVDLDNTNVKRHLALRIVPTVRTSESSSLRPSLTMGFSEGSPKVGLGVDYTMRFGETADRRVPFRPAAERDRRRKQRRAQDRAKDRGQPSRERPNRQPLVLPGEPSGDTGTEPQRDPQRARQLAEQGRNAFQEGNLDRAIAKLEQAVQFDPKNVEILSNLGSLHYRRNNLKKARTYYERAVEADPQDQYAQLFLGITFQKLGRPEKARRHLKKARTINPTSDAGRKASSRLEELNQ